MSAVDTALQDVRTFTVNKASINKVNISSAFPTDYKIAMLQLYTYVQVTFFLTSLTDGSSTGVTDGESVEGSAFIERILVRANPWT